MNRTLKVIIRCLVYNHEPYLRDCLEGFVMQKTNFLFKAVVHDDCSTDGSAAIIREYAEKYPDIIEPIYETENQYFKKGGALGKIMNAASLGRSEYIAYCEGDDYWADPFKLQKQVDFLDENPDYSMCFSACKILNEKNLYTPLKGENIEDRDYDSSELMQNWIVPTASIMVRADVAQDDRLTKPDSRKKNGDIIIVLTAADHGKVRGMRDALVVYRVHPGGITYWQRSGEAQKRHLRGYYNHYTYIKEKFPKLNRIIIKMYRWRSLRDIIESPLFSPREKCSVWFRALWIAPRVTIRYFLNSWRISSHPKASK